MRKLRRGVALLAVLDSEVYAGPPPATTTIAATSRCEGRPLVRSRPGDGDGRRPAAWVGRHPDRRLNDRSRPRGRQDEPPTDELGCEGDLQHQVGHDLHVHNSDTGSPWRIGQCGPVTVGHDAHFDHNAGSGTSAARSTRAAPLTCFSGRGRWNSRRIAASAESVHQMPERCRERERPSVLNTMVRHPVVAPARPSAITFATATTTCVRFVRQLCATRAPVSASRMDFCERPWTPVD